MLIKKENISSEISEIVKSNKIMNLKQELKTVKDLVIRKNILKELQLLKCK